MSPESRKSQIFSIWKQRIGLVQLDPVNAQICELHFDYRCKTGYDCALDDDSIPTINLPSCGQQTTVSKCFYLDADDSSEESEFTISYEALSYHCRFCYCKGMLYQLEASTYRNQSFLSLINIPTDPTPENPSNACLSCLKSIIISNRLSMAVEDSNRVLNLLQLRKHNSKLVIKSRNQMCDIKFELAFCNLILAESASVKNDASYNNLVEIIEDDYLEKSIEKHKILRQLLMPKEGIKESEHTTNFLGLQDQQSHHNHVDKENSASENSDDDDECFLIGKIEVKDEIMVPVYSENSCSHDQQLDTDPLESTCEEVRIAGYSCDMCSFSTNYKVNLENHKKIHADKHFHCKKCDLVFSERRYFVSHNSRVHADDFICKFCDKSHASAKELADHLPEHQHVQCGVCSTVLKRSGYNTHMRIHKQKLCTLCGKMVNWRHVCRENLQEILKCTHCSFTTRFPINLKRHLNLHEIEVKRFLCNDCGQGFRQNGTLTQHLKQHAQLDEPLTCSLCSTQYKTRYEYRLHNRSHNRTNAESKKEHWNDEEEVYVCPECRWKSPSSHSFQKHMHQHSSSPKDCPSSSPKRRTIPNPSTSDKVACVECGKWYPSRIHLFQHMKTHSDERPYKCSTCLKSFRQPGHLQTHTISMHGDGRSYQCTICDKSFKSTIHLKLHLKRHTDEPTKCKHCDKSYTKQNIYRHLRDAHDIRSWRKQPKKTT